MSILEQLELSCVPTKRTWWKHPDTGRYTMDEPLSSQQYTLATMMLMRHIWTTGIEHTDTCGNVLHHLCRLATKQRW